MHQWRVDSLRSCHVSQGHVVRCRSCALALVARIARIAVPCGSWCFGGSLGANTVSWSSLDLRMYIHRYLKAAKAV